MSPPGRLAEPTEGISHEELENLFLPAWHPVATVGDLAKPGSFLTFDLLETPILIRNFDGELRAFLNVCPHRHSKLTEKPCGNTERLRCQYHGWEFNQDGHTEVAVACPHCGEEFAVDIAGDAPGGS